VIVRGLSPLRRAVQFLTILPVGRLSAPSPADLAGSMAWFPLVGAVIGGGAGAFGWFVGGGGLVSSVAALAAAALLTGALQQSYELWVIPPGGKPHSLGLVDPKRSVKVVVPPELLPHVSADSTLAISIEPVGGSPTGQPTGPVIANGKLASL